MEDSRLMYQASTVVNLSRIYFYRIKTVIVELDQFYHTI